MARVSRKRHSERPSVVGTADERIDQSWRLFTWHGTVVFVDTTSGELRHGLLESSPFNVALVSEGQTARLRFFDSGQRADIACLQDCSAVVVSEGTRANDAAATGTVFEHLHTGGVEFGLSARGLFLSAEPDGPITLSRPHFRAWERFHTRADTSEISGTIVTYRIDGRMVHFFIVNRRDEIQSYQCRGDFYEREALDIIKRYCQPEKTFVDIGANIGNHAIFISKFCGVKDIVVFEPNPIAIPLLRANLALNECRNVDTRYIGLALGSKAKQVSVFNPADNNLGGARTVDDGQGSIRCIPGDDVLLSRPVGFMKIDVEGSEFDVLEGLRKTIDLWRPNIFIEVWDKNQHMIQTWCDQYGYKILIPNIDGHNFLLAAEENTA